MPPEFRACPECGAPLFAVVPGVTTPEEIRAFARENPLFAADGEALQGWLHPGAYCPNGDYQESAQFPPVPREPEPLLHLVLLNPGSSRARLMAELVTILRLPNRQVKAVIDRLPAVIQTGPRSTLEATMERLEAVGATLVIREEP